MTATQQSASLEHGSLTLPERFRSDFPILEQSSSEGLPLIYLDHAATSQKPRQVLDALLHLSLIHISEPTRRP